MFLFSGISDGSSEDEPLTNLVKKRQAQAKVKTAKKKDTAPKKLREKHVSGKASRGVRNKSKLDK